jgi:microcystin-dependent protein
MSEGTLGEIRMFAGNFAPRHWKFCDGSILPIPSNTALFALLGTIYGGDGKTNFQLPDLRGNIIVGPGLAAGFSPYKIGQSGGAETVHLQPDQVPQHSHSVLAASANADSLSPDGASFGTVASDANLYVDTSKPTNPMRRQYDPQVIEPSGASPAPEPHNNMMPSVALNFIICVAGYFPSRPQ